MLHGVITTGRITLQSASVEGTFFYRQSAGCSIARAMKVFGEEMEKSPHRFRRTRFRIVILLLPLLLLLYRSVKSTSVFTLLRSLNPPSAKELYSALSHLAQNCQMPAKLSVYGTSQSGHSLQILCLGNASSTLNRTVLVTAGLHGREQQGPLGLLLAVGALCRETKSLGQAVLLVAPLKNPDGYERSRMVSKTWRKTSPSVVASSIDCKPPNAPGVDLNRNFPLGWTPSSDPCSATYSGTHPLSEAESIALAELVRKSSGNLQVHLDVHSFGSVLFRGTARGSGGASEVLDRQKSLARAIRIAVRKRTGVDYEDWSANVDPVSGTIRSIGGTFMDFVTEMGVPSVTMELGPKWTMENRASGFFESRNMTTHRAREIEEAIKVVLRAANGDIVEYPDNVLGKINP